MIKPMKGYATDINSFVMNNSMDEWVAEPKLDGHRIIMHFSKDRNYLYTRTGKDVSDNLPHLRDYCLPFLEGTILDGELLAPSGIFADVQTINFSKPEKSIAFQKENGWAILNVFDIIQLNNENIQDVMLTDRRLVLDSLMYSEVFLYNEYIKEVVQYDCQKINTHRLLISIWDAGGEGLMLKRKDSKYLQKKSKFWYKIKASKTFDVIITGYTEPTKEYEGKTDLSKWPYWENDLTDLSKNPKPVTKPYAMGWCGAVKFGVVLAPNQGVKNDSNINIPVIDKKLATGTVVTLRGYPDIMEIGECRGFTENDLEYIKNNQKKLIGTCIEVKAQGIIDKDKGTLRHPQFNRWRPDKNPLECTFENHIKEDF